MRKITLRDGTSVGLAKLEEQRAKEAGLYIWKCSCGARFLTLYYSIFHVQKKHPGDNIKDRIQLADDIQYDRKKWDELYETVTQLIVGPVDSVLEKVNDPNFKHKEIQEKELFANIQNEIEAKKESQDPEEKNIEADELEEGEIRDEDESQESNFPPYEDYILLHSWEPHRIHQYETPRLIEVNGPVITDDPVPLLSMNITKPDKILPPRKRKNRSMKSNKNGQKLAKLLISECEEQMECIENSYFYEDVLDFDDENYEEETFYDRVMSPLRYQISQPVCKRVCKKIKKSRKHLVLIR